MERLTDKETYCSFVDCDYERNCKMNNQCYNKQLYDKLKEYEELEEKGLLLKLPCKIGDKVYRFCGAKGSKYVDWRTVSSMTYRLDYKRDIVWEIFTTTTDVLGKTVFITKEEAEEKLRKLQNK